MACDPNLMPRIGFVACSKTKNSLRLPAAALYTSPLFRKSLLAAIDQSERVYILSAKHGLLNCNDVIEPYELTLKTMKRSDRIAWGYRVGAQLDSVLRPCDSAMLLCGKEYLVPLQPDLDRLQAEVESPLGSLSMGSRLSLLYDMNGEADLRAMGQRFFWLMKQVWVAQSGGRRIEATNGRQTWPSRGVYFILAPNNSGASGQMPRIIRVGTHAVSEGSKTTLWDRVSTHRGTSGGGGSHRSSIFRLHVGRAWARYAAAEAWPDSWAKGQSAPLEVRQCEEQLERQVSRLIGAMQVLWLNVDDAPSPQSERAYLERNAIGLLSRLGLLNSRVEADWLGHFSSDWRIASSGLWNLNHVFRRPDPDFIERLTIAVERTIHRRLSGNAVRADLDNDSNQLSLLPESHKK
jgi:hypothetical protein